MKLCSHFGICGGCSFQDVDYEQQLICKQDSVRKLLPSCGLDSVAVKPINSYDNLFYRGKMEFSFADTQGNLVCGLYGKNFKRTVIDVLECLIFSPDTGKILAAVKDFCRQKCYPVYDKFSHRGFLRNLILRKTKFTKQMMVGIVTTGEDELDKEIFVSALKALSLEDEIKSIYWVKNDSLSDAVIFEHKELLWGGEFIGEDLGGMKFDINIDSFFQVNSIAAADFYSKIRNYAALSGKESVLDLFCGVGGIGLFLAGKAKFVWGVEIQKDIIDMACWNAKLNAVENVSFFNSDVRKFLNTQQVFYRNTDIVVINPPRSGVSQKVIRAILRLQPKTIFYSSCNLQTLCQNLKDLSGEYRIEFIEPFDFFPHTRHLECFSVLKRIGS